MLLQVPTGVLRLSAQSSDRVMVRFAQADVSAMASYCFAYLKGQTALSVECSVASNGGYYYLMIAQQSALQPLAENAVLNALFFVTPVAAAVQFQVTIARNYQSFATFHKVTRPRICAPHTHAPH